jgi:hypothetical protein
MSQYDEPARLDDPDGAGPLQRGPRLRESRGTTVLVLGILGLVVCVICGIIAWSMGASDLRAMREGTMERRGESETRIGMILGIVSTILLGLGILLVILMVAGIFTFGAAMVHEGGRKGGFFDQVGSAIDKTTARTQLESIARAVDTYQTTTGKLPATLKDLTRKSDQVPAPLMLSIPRDPWAREYEYVPEGTARYRLFSTGPDGQADTEDDIQYVQVKTER